MSYPGNRYHVMRNESFGWDVIDGKRGLPYIRFLRTRRLARKIAEILNLDDRMLRKESGQ